MTPHGTQLLTTPRLTLRFFALSDAKAMFQNWASDEVVTHFLTWPPHDNIKTTTETLEHWINQYPNPTFYQWAIEITDSHELIGTISVVNLSEDLNTAEIGYCIGKNWWGNGYMTEALQAVVHYFFINDDFTTLTAKHDIKNTASGRVMTKAGFHFDKITYQAHQNNQGLCDTAHYIYDKADYLSLINS